MFDRPEGERDGDRVVAALRRRWWVIVLTAVLAAAAGYVLSSRQTKQYKATGSLLFLNSTLDQELTSKQIVNTNIDPLRQATTNQSLVKLPTVSRMAAAQLGISASRVHREVSFGSGATSDVMTVSVTDGNRYMAARIANAYLRQYIQFRKHAAISQLNTVENLVASKLAAIPPDQRGGSVAQRLVADRNELDLRKSAQTGDAEVVETAAIPRSPSSPNPKKDGALGLLLGLLVGAALATLLDRRDRRIKTIEEVESIYGVPVIGSVPESSSLRLGGPGTPRDEEAFLMIRAQLRYFNVDRHIRRVMVTSANMGEGKSLISLNLARTAARTDDRRTLLIEADLRRPTLGTLMGRSGVAGLAELLSHAQELDTGLRDLVVTPDRMHDHPGRLDVLLAGATAPNPAELIESRRMEALLEAADSIYDTIIIDTPPIGLVSDAVPLVQKVDGLLVINRMGISRRDHAVHVVKRFRSLNARLLGVVVNSFRMPDKGDYGYYAQPGSNGMGKHGLLPHQPDARIR